MAVALTISETLDGSAIADSLDGGGSGVDMGNVSSSSFAPLTDKNNNQGHQNLYISHDGAQEISNVKFFIQEFGTGSGDSYGGGDSAADDYTRLVSYGQNSGSSKNNSNGLSGGFWIDMDWDSTDSTRFDHANFPSVVKIFGDNGTDGIDIDSAFNAHTAGCVYNNASVETSASAPATGKIGPAGNTTLGDSYHAKVRIYLPSTATVGSVMQWEFVVSYSYED